MRRSRVAAIVGAVLALLVVLPHGGAMARDTSGNLPRAPVISGLVVQELNFVFVPDPAKVPLGQTVRWVNPVRNAHTTTGEAPLSLWDSGDMGYGKQFLNTFTAAGLYPYVCTRHVRFDMVSSVGVRDEVDPPGGPVGTVFTVTVASIPAPTDYVYDVQMREPGGSWQDWMTGVTSMSVQFDSTGKVPGIYRFRSRLHRVSDDASSDYSPPVPISVTP